MRDEAEEANASSESSTDDSSTGSEAVTDEGSGESLTLGSVLMQIAFLCGQTVHLPFASRDQFM